MLCEMAEPQRERGGGGEGGGGGGGVKEEQDVDTALKILTHLMNPDCGSLRFWKSREITGPPLREEALGIIN